MLMRKGAHVGAPYRDRCLSRREPQRRSTIEADPDGRDDVGRVADEPGVAIVVGRAGLPCHVAEAVALETRGRAALHDAAQQRVHDVGGASVRHAGLPALAREERLAVIVPDLTHEIRLEPYPPTWEGAVYPRQFSPRAFPDP